MNYTLTTPFQEFTKDEDKALQEIFDIVADGGSLVDVSNKFNIPYGLLVSWIFGAQNRADRYKDATLIRDGRSAENVRRIIEDIVSVDIRDLFDVNGNILPVKKWPTGIARSISSFSLQETVINGAIQRKLNVKFFDKAKCLQILTGASERNNAQRQEKTLEALVVESISSPS